MLKILIIAILLFCTYPQTPQYGDRLVNTYTANDQLLPKVSALTNGGFSVIYQSERSDLGHTAIYGQCYDMNGTHIGPEFKASTFDTQDLEHPSATGLNDGFIAVWHYMYDPTRLVYQVMARAFDNAGNPRTTSEFSVSDSTNTGHNPSIFGFFDGGYIVGWEWNSDKDVTDRDLQARVFDEYDGIMTPFVAGSHIEITSQTDLSVYNSSDIRFTSSAADGFIGTWNMNFTGSPSLNGVYFNMYQTDGTRIFPADIRVNVASLPTPEAYPAITNLTNGGFVIVWGGQASISDSFYTIWAQIYDNIGTTTISEFPVNTNNNWQHMRPDAGGLQNGNFVVTFESYGEDGDLRGIYARIFKPDGTPINPVEFRVNTETSNDQAEATVIGLLNGEFVVTWASYGQDGSGWGVYIKRFNENGTDLPFGDLYPQCFANGTCIMNYTCEPASSACHQCDSDQNCTDYFQPKDYCNSTTHECQQCLTNSNCPEQGEKCDQSEHVCFECYSNADCEANFAPRNTCNIENHVCYRCLFNVNCTNGETCYLHQCVECVSNQNCTEYFQPSTTCAISQNRCAQCLNHEDCGNQVCDPNTKMCVQCLSNSDCPGQTPNCNLNQNICQGCIDDSSCPGAHCDPGTKQCVECVTNSECPLVAPICNPETNICSSCIDNTTCNSTTMCVKGYCIQCETDLSCQQHYKPSNYCDRATDSCKECLSNAHCISHICYEDTGECAYFNQEETDQSVTNIVNPIAGIIAIAAQDPAVYFAVVRLFQAVFYFLFFNVELPQNLLHFISKFTLGRFQFFISLPQLLNINLEEFRLPSPRHFYEYQYSGFMLDTCGSIITMFMLYGLLSLVVSILNSVTLKRIPVINKFANSVGYDFMVNLYCGVYTETLYGSFLQILQHNFTQGIYSISTGGSIFLIIYAFCFPILIFYLIREGDATAPGFEPATKEYAFHKKGLAKYGFIVQYVKRGLLPILMVLLYNRPFFQVVLIWCLNIGYLYFLVRYWPRRYYRDNVIEIIQEFCYFANHFMISFLVNENVSYQVSQGLGVGIITGFGIIICAQVVSIILGLFHQCTSFLKKRRTKTKNDTRFIDRNAQFKAGRFKKIPKKKNQPIIIEEEDSLK